MGKRKLEQNQKVSDDEVESQRPLKQFRQRNSTADISVKNISLSSNEEHDSMDSDTSNLPGSSKTEADDSYYEDFSSFMRAFSFDAESDDEHQKFNDTSRKGASAFENSLNVSKQRKSPAEPTHFNSSAYVDTLEELLEPKVRILSFPFKLSEVVLLQHPASLTLHGYVNVSVCLGSISIYGFNIKEGNDVQVFSTEGTGLKQAVTLKSVHKSTIKTVKKKLKKVAYLDKEFENLEDLVDDIGPTSVVLIISKILLPTPLQILELYYPNALQARWPRSENSEKEKSLKLSSTEEQSFVIDIGEDFKMLSREVIKMATEAVSDNAGIGCRIFVTGDANTGKSTLIRYLMNCSLNKNGKVYFLDTDPGQTEYTPPGAVSLYQVTKPLFGPPFAHQKKALKMIFYGSVTPATNPELYEKSVSALMKYFMKKFGDQILFVNTIGWTKGVGVLCIQAVKDVVKPTVVIELVSPEPNISMTKDIVENGVTHFKVPSKAPPKDSYPRPPHYNSKELRNFNIVAYFGQCHPCYMPVTLMNSFRPYALQYDDMALYVMGKKVEPRCIVEAIHCSIVALCRVDLSYMLKSDNPALPKTLSEDPVCECLGFGLVRASDELNHIFYILTPLTLDQLENVNVLIKGNVMIPDEIFLKQTIQNEPLPFTQHSQSAKSPASKALRKRAFFRTVNKNA